jgi:AcrR family transcriptional regulator
MPQPPSQGRSATADEIRQAALEQFAQVGYEATTMREIAGSVGIKAASLYNHFGSKEAILWDLTLTALTELAAGSDAASSALPANAASRERLAAFVAAHVTFHASHRNQALVVNGQLGALSAPHYRRAVALRAAYESALRTIVEVGVTAGDFATPDLRVTTFAILQMGVAVSAWYRPDGQLTIDELCAIYVELAEKMLAPRPMAKGRAR